MTQSGVFFAANEREERVATMRGRVVRLPDELPEQMDPAVELYSRTPLRTVTAEPVAMNAELGGSQSTDANVGP